MFPVHLGRVTKILCLGAHADDIEIGCGGTLLAILAQQPAIEVTWVVLSAAGPRRKEAQAGAAAFLGGAARSVVVRRFRDTFFPYIGGRIKEFFAELAGRVSPDIVFTHRRDDLHQDHRLTAELTWNTFRDHTIFEYEVPKYDGDLGQPSLFVPLDAATAQRKIELLLAAYPTQRARPWFRAETFGSLLRLRGLECNSPSGLAEAFYVRKLTLSGSYQSGFPA